MKLTKLQQVKIEEMIKQEMTNLKEGWNHAGKLHNKSKRNQKNLFEASALESDLSQSSVESALEQSTLDSGQACLAEFDHEVLNHILSVLKSHGLVDSAETASTLSDSLEDYDGNQLVDLQQQAAADIAAILSKYASEVAHMATMMYSGGDV
jgi:hypothetical protein